MENRDLHQKIEEFLKNTELKTTEKKELILGFAGDAIVKNAAENGIDITGFVHSLDNFFVNHALKNHGNEKSEKSRGNVHITIDDIKNIPDVLQAPDFIIYGTKTKVGNKAIIFTKNLSDSTIFVEEIRNGKQRLAAQTLYKLPRTIDVSFIKNAPELYAHSDPGTIKIVDVKNEIVKQQLFKEIDNTSVPATATKSLEEMVYKGAAVTIGNQIIKCKHGLLEEFRKNYHLLEAEREKTKSLTEQIAELKKQVREQRQISRQSSRSDDFGMEY